MAQKTVLLIFKRGFLTFLVLALVLMAGISRYTYVVLAKKAYYPLAGKIVVIDPGHGGVDSGTNEGGFKEKQVNLEVALKVRSLLTMGGAKVVMTRTEDADASHRGDPNKKRYHRDMDGRRLIIAESKADVFISLHVNSCRAATRTRGAFTFYSKDSEENKLLAETLQSHLNNLVDGYKKTGELASHEPRTANYYLLRNTNIPAVLVEMGFMTHAEEKKLLLNESYQEKLAQAIVDGLREYFLLAAEGNQS